MENKLDAIIRKVKGLMAIANDAANDDEAQSAFLLAQRLMMKHNIEQSQIVNSDEKECIIQGQASAYKTIFWWEKILASIISDNFRVKGHINMKRENENEKYRSTIIFFGLAQDVKIAKEIFILASEAISFHAKCYINNHYMHTGKARIRKQTADLKNSYIKGFLSGLQNKLDEQRFALQNEYGLVLLTPKIVEDEYEAFQSSGKIRFTGTTSIAIPDVEEIAAYQEGYNQGERIDYTQSTVDGSVDN